MNYSGLKGLLTTEECAALESVAAKLEKAGWESRDYDYPVEDELREIAGWATRRIQYDRPLGPQPNYQKIGGTVTVPRPSRFVP